MTNAPATDEIDQTNVLALLEYVEDGGMIDASDLNDNYPILCEYMARSGWLGASTRYARATVQGMALLRFAALSTHHKDPESGC